MFSLDSLGSILIALVVIASVAGGLYMAFSKTNVASTEQDLIVLRMQTQSFFMGTNYDGLSNEVAIKAGIVPKGMNKGGTLRNAWGGDVTLTPDTSNGRFSIELTNIPQEECTQLSRFQSDAWQGVSVNGSAIDPSDPAAVADACSDTNTVTYTAQ